MKTIFILTDIGFSKRDFDRWGVKELEKKFNVFILDFTKNFNKEYFKVNPEKYFKYKNYICVNNLEHFTNLIKKKKCNFAIDFLQLEDYSFQIRRYLQMLKIKQVFIQSGINAPKKRNLKEKLLRVFNLISSISAFKKKAYSIINNYFKKNKFKNFLYDLIIVTGQFGEKDFRVKISKKVLYSHSFDYEKFYRSKKIKKKYLKKNYAVFLDQNLPVHSGFTLRGEKHIISEKKYYMLINKFFFEFEKKFNIEIIIAAHPRSNHTKLKNPFNNRTIIKKNKIDLIKNSKAVLSHTSTAISYAMIFKKPLIFLNFKEFEKSFDDFYIRSLARETESCLINLEKFKLGPKNSIFVINKKKYDLYLRNYVKHPKSINCSIWKLLLKYLI